MISPEQPFPIRAYRLCVDGRPWSFDRETDQYFSLTNVPVAFGSTTEANWIPFSYLASPGIYLSALAKFAAKLGLRSVVLLINPHVNVGVQTFEMCISSIGDWGFTECIAQKNDVLIITDAHSNIIAYAFHDGLKLSENFIQENIRFLSCTNALLDKEILSFCGFRPKIKPILNHVQALPPANFEDLPGTVYLYEASALSRLNMLKANVEKCYAITTHHAGDVLLSALAIRQVPNRITGVVTHESFAPIVRKILPGHDLITVSGPVPSRGKVNFKFHPYANDATYFENEIFHHLPLEASFVFLRHLRPYGVSSATLMAQIAFALNQNLEFFNAYLPAKRYNLGELETIKSFYSGNKILLHFDGGWPLKVYPKKWQQILIGLLIGSGFEVVVLAESEHTTNYTCKPFSSLSELTHDIERSAIVIGMDSFPCHYASLVLEKPTLCLFGPTSFNNLSHKKSCYVALDCWLPCSPCNEATNCNVYSGSECHNFVAPEIIHQFLLSSRADP